MLVFQYQCKKCYSVFEEEDAQMSSVECLFCGNKEVFRLEKSFFIKERDCSACPIKKSCGGCGDSEGCSKCSSKCENYIY
jgi:hypothetical protein